MAINLTIDVPVDAKLIDTSALRSQLTEFAKILLLTPSIKKAKEEISTTNQFVEPDTKPLKFPTIPADFQLSKEIKSLGVDFPTDFDIESIKDEMYNSFAK